MGQIHQMLINAPATTREKYRPLTATRLVNALAACRPASHDCSNRPLLVALKALAQRHQFLHAQARDLQAQIAVVVDKLNPALVTVHGVGPNTAAQLLITGGGNPDRLRSEASFAALCGTAPVPASSGKTTRHRLSRGGDRAANSALHVIAIVRMAKDPRTKAFVADHRAKGRSTTEIIRILKRAIAREIFHHLARPQAVPDIADIRQARRKKNITLTVAATGLDTYPNWISRIEHGTHRDDTFADRYRTWLNAA